MKSLRNLLNNEKGLTLIEVLVGIIIFSILIMGVSAVLVPTLNTYVKAKEMAELTTLMNSASAEVVEDLSQSRGKAKLDGSYAKSTGSAMQISIDGIIEYKTEDGVLLRSFDGVNFSKVFDEKYYKGKEIEMIFGVEYDEPNPVDPTQSEKPTYSVFITISNSSTKLDSEFVVRPLVLNQ